MLRLRGDRNGTNTLSFTHSNGDRSVSLSMEDLLLPRNQAYNPVIPTRNYIDPFEFSTPIVNRRRSTGANLSSIETQGQHIESLVSRVVEEVSNGVMDDLFQLHQEEDEENHTPASSQAITALPRREPSDSEVQEEVKCPICLESFATSDTLVEMPCQHCFHEDCLKKWLSSDNTCPVCRQILEDKGPDSDTNDVVRHTDPIDLDNTTVNRQPISLQFRLETGEIFSKTFDSSITIKDLLQELQTEMSSKLPGFDSTSNSLVMRNRDTGEIICNLDLLNRLIVNPQTEINITSHNSRPSSNT